MAEDPTKKNDILELAPETRLPEEEAAEQEQSGFWKKLKRGLFMTHTELIDKVSDAMSGKVTLDERTFEYLEEVLISSDLGVETSLELVERVRRNALKEQVGSATRLRKILADEIADLLYELPRPRLAGRGPLLTLVVGVNGVGKTTSIAKLARRAQEEGQKVMLAAGDTFRAAAIEQLALWGERLGVEVVRQGQGADPGAVVYDAIHAAKARRMDHLIIDTAGRLHTKVNLMEELRKIKRVIQKQYPDAPHEVLLVIDATTGQNGLQQAKQFSASVGVTGLVLTKLDGTAKGGIILAINHEMNVPVRFVGVGEKLDDLQPFDKGAFVDALFAP